MSRSDENGSEYRRGRKHGKSYCISGYYGYENFIHEDGTVIEKIKQPRALKKFECAYYSDGRAMFAFDLR